MVANIFKRSPTAGGTDLPGQPQASGLAGAPISEARPTMADPLSPSRITPTLGPDPRPASPGGAELRAAVEQAAADRGTPDQWSRIEEKTARIEEKFARAEALMLRLESKIETATGRTEDAARMMQNEVQSVSRRLRLIPGFGALMLMGVLIALLSAGATVLALRYGVPGLIPPQP